MSRLFAAIAATVAVFFAGLGFSAHAQDAQRRSTPDEGPEPTTPTPTEPPNLHAPDVTSEPLSDPQTTVPPDCAPRHAKPSEPASEKATPTHVPQPAKPAKPKHAKPSPDPSAKPGDHGPFADAEGDGKHLDDLLNYMLRDKVVPMGGRSDRPLSLNSPSR